MDCYQNNFLLRAKYQLGISAPGALCGLVILSMSNLQMAQTQTVMSFCVERVEVSVDQDLLADFKGNSYISSWRLLWKSVFCKSGSWHGSYLRFIFFSLLDLFWRWSSVHGCSFSMRKTEAHRFLVRTTWSFKKKTTVWRLCSVWGDFCLSSCAQLMNCLQANVFKMMWGFIFKYINC